MRKRWRLARADRRQFLKGVAATGTAAAVAAAAGPAFAQMPAEPSTEHHGKRGYRLTAHIAQYYGKARF